MKHPDIDFLQVRPQDGSRHTGFEELAAQLSSLEEQPVGSVFVRKGRGGDGGLECFVRLANGDEIGWQAKYVFDWAGSLSAQLDKSVRAALDKHPKLIQMIVCLPFDLSDSRTKGGKSARQKWEAWKQKWEKKARDSGRAFSIELWGKSELIGRLSIDKPANSGRLFYWFGKEVFSSAWFIEQFGKAKLALGSRYTPETNVELPIRRDFLACARDPSLEVTVQEWWQCLAERAPATLRTIDRIEGGPAASERQSLSEALGRLNQALNCGEIGPEKAYPTTLWQEAVQACYAAYQATLEWVYALSPDDAKNGPSDQASARTELSQLRELLSEIDVAMRSDMWRLANARAVLLKGAAGTGKSHLLGDIVEHQVHVRHPAILVLGSAMVEDDPWRQVMVQLDLPSDLQAKQFLGSLDAAAQAAGVRAIVCIDAINERHGPDIWPDRLAAFLKTAEAFPRVAIVVSCRTTYVPHVVPSSLGKEQLTVIEHQGFGGRGGEAARIYLTKRGIVRPGAPNLVPEFHNPLFLKTCCDFLERQGQNELPRGLRGVSAIFGFYNRAIVRAVTRRMKLDPNLDLVETALERFSDILVARRESYAPKTEVIAAFEAVLPSGGSLDRSFLAQFESEGVLAIEPVWQDNKMVSTMVRFTFERYSDHAIAARLLGESVDKQNVEASFAAGTALGDLVFGSKNYRFAGVIEAIAIQLPEMTGVEIVDLRPDDDWTVQQAFMESLLWREQSFFTNRTLEIVQILRDENEVNDVLVSIATEPDNKFNANFLHTSLSAMPMAERDERWSVYVNQCGRERDPIGILIEWAIENGTGSIVDKRARLTALTLGWCLTSSNRAVRDKATKGLACLFADRLDLASGTLRTFAEVDDLYVLERVLASAYGAVLQGKSNVGLVDLAQATYEVVFAKGEPPLDALLREHARGMILYAQWRGQLPPSVDLAKVHPPYRSPWPIEHVPDTVIDSYKQESNGVRFADAIVSSTVNDGDFARYVMDYKVRRWAPVPLMEKACPSYGDLATIWIEGFLSTAEGEQLSAFEALIEAAKSTRGQRSYAKTPEQEAVKAAERRLQASVSSDTWETYRVTAKDHVLYQMFSDDARDSSARFNNGWARRWVCKRAHELGWTPERFAVAERSTSRSRHEHRVERIGKKYQWMALRELVARMSDNLLFMGEGYGNDGPKAYKGARTVGLRDIDPSLLVAKTHYDGWRQWPRTWWVPVEPRLRPVPPLERLAWLDSDADLLNDASLIELTDPKTNRRWLPLHGFSSWRQSGIDGDSKELQRETWYRVSCIVVAKKDKERVARGLAKRIIIDPHGMPEFELDSSFYLGEYPWHPDLKEVDDWIEPVQWNRFAAPVNPTTADYLCEHGGYDHSIDETIRIKLPAPWLADAMGLRLLNGKRPAFVDSEGVTRFFDPSVFEPGYHAALVDRDAFLTCLDSRDLSAIWVIAGEKGVFGGHNRNQGFGGRVLHTTVYRLSKTGFTRTIHTEREMPSVDQLTALLGKKPSAALIARFAKPVSRVMK